MKEHLSDLRYCMSKDNTSGTRKWFIMLAIIWILAIILTIFMPCMWLIPVFRGVNILLKFVVSIGWAVTFIMGIVFWVYLTKNG